MDARQYSHIARSSALVALFSTRPETGGITGLPEAFALYAAQLDHVETLVKRQAQSLALVLHGRDAAFNAMKIATLLVAGKVSAFAARTHSDTLALKVKVKSNDLDRARFVERVRCCQRIHGLVAEVWPAVAASGVTTAMLDDLQTKIDAARGFLTAPRATVVDKSTATVQLAEAIRELNAILTKQIEPLVAPCEFTHREFFLKYRAARKLIAPPSAPSAAAEEPVSDTPVAATVSDTSAPSLIPAAPTVPAAPEPAHLAASEAPPTTLLVKEEVSESDALLGSHDAKLFPSARSHPPADGAGAKARVEGGVFFITHAAAPASVPAVARTGPCRGGGASLRSSYRRVCYRA